MFELIILAIALSMDAFAVSIGLGSKQGDNTTLAFKSAIYFGIFQGLMPLIGFLGGQGVGDWVDGYTHWIAAGLLLLVGSKMIYESMAEGIEEDIAQITHKLMLLLAIATSVDAMAAGFSLPLLDVNPFIACVLIGFITAFFSFIGVFIGNKSGTLLESKAELLGGIVIILIGCKILLL